MSRKFTSRKKLSSKISLGVRRYWRKVKRIQKSYGLDDIRSARARYRTDVLQSSRRYQRLALRDIKERPRYISLATVKKYGKVLRRGRDKGKIVLYYDTLKKRPVTARHALRMRYDNAIARLAIRAQILTKTQQKFFADKYWPRYAKKRGYLTEFEAKRMIRKLLRLRWKDFRVRIALRNIYGYA